MATVQKKSASDRNNQNSSGILMNDDAQLYNASNGVTRIDAIQCLEEYASKLKWERAAAKVFDIGSGDGSVTSILSKYVPSDYEKLIGCDINEKMATFANEHYGNEKMKFMVLDIVADLPDELKESFDHVFSFCAFHWIPNQEKGFKNIFNLLSGDGECLVTLVGQTAIYSLFAALSRTEKWGPWLTECGKFLSPYYDCNNPDNKISEMLEKIGFHDIDVKCKQKLYIFESIQHFKDMVTSVNPFKFPEGMYEEFMDDYIQLARSMGIVNDNNHTVKFNYNSFIIHCKKEKDKHNSH